MAPLRTPAPADRMLVPANLALLALLVVHALDHALRQDAAVPAAAGTLGMVGLLAAVASLGLAAVGARLAPVVTAAVGLGTAVGFLVVHVLPDWGPFSQPYESLGVDAVSWIGMLLPMAGAALVGAIGVSAARRRETAER